MRVQTDDSLSLTLHLWVRPLKYDEKHFIAAWSKPKCDILRKMISWSIVSNALVRSIKTTPFRRPLSMFSDQAFMESPSRSSHLELLSKKFSSRSCLKFRGGNDDRNGIYSSHTEVISDVILLVYPLRDALAKTAAVSHEMAQHVLKIAHLAISILNQPHYWKMYPVAVSYPDYGSWSLNKITNNWASLEL